MEFERLAFCTINNNILLLLDPSQQENRVWTFYEIWTLDPKPYNPVLLAQEQTLLYN